MRQTSELYINTEELSSILIDRKKVTRNLSTIVLLTLLWWVAVLPPSSAILLWFLSPTPNVGHSMRQRHTDTDFFLECIQQRVLTSLPPSTPLSLSPSLYLYIAPTTPCCVPALQPRASCCTFSRARRHESAAGAEREEGTAGRPYRAQVASRGIYIARHAKYCLVVFFLLVPVTV
jgi:hypothetical protein